MGAVHSILFMIPGAVLLALTASGWIEMGPMGYLGSIGGWPPRRSRASCSRIPEWAAGELAELNKSFQSEGTLSYERFVKKYRPIEGGALQVMFTQFPPLPHEYLVGVGDADSTTKPGWFVLTIQRLILKDAAAGMKSGRVTTVEKLEKFPRAEFLNHAISRQKRVKFGMHAG